MRDDDKARVPEQSIRASPQGRGTPIPARAGIARAREIVRWEGIGGLLRRGLRKILHPVARMRRLLFFEMDLTQQFPKIEARVPLEMRVAPVEDLETREGSPSLVRPTALQPVPPPRPAAQ